MPRKREFNCLGPLPCTNYIDRLYVVIAHGEQRSGVFAGNDVLRVEGAREGALTSTAGWGGQTDAELVGPWLPGSLEMHVHSGDKID
jgi:hypothetical protein